MSLLDKASLVQIPSGYKATKLYSVVPDSGAGDLSFARSSSATRVNESGIIETIAIDTPRLDYTGGGCGKLLIEPQRTNTVLSNSDYTIAYWGNANVVITQNATISPNGSNNAQKLTSANTFGQHFLRQIIGGHTLGTAYVYSCFAKAAELDILTLRLLNGDGPNVTFDLTNGTIISGTNGKIIDYGNGWYRCMTYHSALSSNLYPYIYTQVGNQQGDGVSGLYVYGAMLEEGTVETSLIDTTNAAVTRTQDVSKTSGLSASINSVEGVLFWEGNLTDNDTVSSFISMSDGTNTVNNSLNLQLRPSSNSLWWQFIVGNSIQVSKIVTLTDIFAKTKLAFKWEANNFCIFENGTKISFDTAGITFSASTLNSLYFAAANTVGSFNTNLKTNALTVYNTALSDADLTELTTL